MGLFGGKKSITLPPPPTFYQNPYVMPAIQQGLGFGNDFINQGNALSPSLREAVSTSPDASRLAIEAATAQLQPSLRKSRQDLISQLEANNQLTSSTTASTLGNMESDFLSQITSAGLNAAVADINRALTNRISLAQSGLGAIGNAGNQALTDQGQHNEFNLANYENEVAKVLAGQKSESGGLFGGLMGGLGGVLGGLALAPFTGGSSLIPALAGGLIGGVSGYAGPQGTGGSMLTAGAGLSGARLARPISSNPYSLASTNTGESINNNLLMAGLGQQGGFWPNLMNGMSLN